MAVFSDFAGGLMPLRAAAMCLLVVLSAARGRSDVPRLAVVISIDQFRADYLVRFRPYFGGGGFARLLEGGADFRNCHHRHAITQTAPGHASILSGVHAEIHGITANEFLDRDTWEMVAAVEDAGAPLVGIKPAELGPLAARSPQRTGRSPRRFHATTVGDQLKLRYGSRCRVFSASNKDRAAILLGGKLADAAYWDENGRFVTSRYYRGELPAWVTTFNAENRVERTRGKSWDRVLPTEVYETVQGPDDAAGESADYGLTRVFPKQIDGGDAKVSPAFYKAFDHSPFSAELLGEFVQRAIVEERLGHHEAPDLLCVGFSQIDTIGHAYGPDSHEVMDSVVRLDRVLAALFACLDREVGPAGWLVVLTADHGASPLPERLRELRPEIPAARVKTSMLERDATRALGAAFGALPEGEMWLARDNAGFHLRPSALAERKVAADVAARVVKASVQTAPFVAAAYTRDDLLSAASSDDSLLAAVRRSYHAPADRDVVYVMRPYFMAKAPTGTTHGSPYAYDTHVPLLWHGIGVPRTIEVGRVGVDDLAPTLAALLGVPRPPEARGRILFRAVSPNENISPSP